MDNFATCSSHTSSFCSMQSLEQHKMPSSSTPLLKSCNTHNNMCSLLVLGPEDSRSSLSDPPTGRDGPSNRRSVSFDLQVCILLQPSGQRGTIPSSDQRVRIFLPARPTAASPQQRHWHPVHCQWMNVQRLPSEILLRDAVPPLDPLCAWDNVLVPADGATLAACFSEFPSLLEKLREMCWRVVRDEKGKLAQLW